MDVHTVNRGTLLYEKKIMQVSINGLGGLAREDFVEKGRGHKLQIIKRVGTASKGIVTIS